MNPTPTTPARRPMLRRRAAFALGVVLAIAAAPALVLASHQFSDVPNTSPYHAQIGALVDAGITAGCGATTFCPKSTVTREQMAAFFGRGLPYSTSSVGFVSATEAMEDFITTVTVPPRAQAGGTAFVEVNASVNVFDSSGSCPCGVIGFIGHLEAKSSAPEVVFLVPELVEGGSGAEGTINWVFEVPTGEEATFGVAAFIFPLTPEPEPVGPGTEGLPGEPEVTGTIVAQYTPFGSVAEIEPPVVKSGFPGAETARLRIQELLDR